MLQNRPISRRNIRLPRQTGAPGMAQIEELWNQSQAHIGQTIELNFGNEPCTYALTALCPKSDEGAQWMLYKNDCGESSMEWSHVTRDPNEILNAIAAQFPEVDLGGERALSSSPIALQQFSESATATADPEEHPVAAAPASPAPAKVRGKTLMEGELKNLPIANLLQSIFGGKMTGRLEVVGERDRGDAYFIDGNATHCTLRGLEGENALIELSSWREGFYRLYHEAPPETKTVQRPLENLVREGSVLRDLSAQLERSSLNVESYLYRVHPNISEKSFEQLLAQGRPIDIGLQKRFYQVVDNRAHLCEILRRVPLSRAEWVPVVHNLLSCQLIGIANTPPPEQKPPADNISPTPIDWNTVRQTEKALERSDTGVYSFPTLLGFMEREYARHQTLKRPFSLVVMEIGTRKENTSELQPISVKALKEMVGRLDRLKRKCDVIGHHETFALGILLPETGAAAAKSFARAAAEFLLGAQPSAQGVNIAINIGSGCIPENCNSLETLLTVARLIR